MQTEQYVEHIRNIGKAQTDFKKDVNISHIESTIKQDSHKI